MKKPSFIPQGFEIITAYHGQTGIVYVTESRTHITLFYWNGFSQEHDRQESFMKYPQEYDQT